MRGSALVDDLLEAGPGYLPALSIVDTTMRDHRDAVIAAVGSLNRK